VAVEFSRKQKVARKVLHLSVKLFATNASPVFCYSLVSIVNQDVNLASVSDCTRKSIQDRRFVQMIDLSN
tara:strand:- start:61382 stop:61591 length:210 start_codon:yes stop_codon:yes gene_type:complete